MSKHPRIAVIGSTGQVARALVARAAARDIALEARGRPDLDITSRASIDEFLGASSPDIVVNAAAYTAVDKAESDATAAFAVNAAGSANIAAACAAAGVPLVHISTDYVFDGSGHTPYVETDATAPLGVYGRSKAEGERLVRAALPRHVILRTSWVYGARGANFLLTMLRLAGERDEVRVVADQHGAPTLADDLADAIIDIAPRLVEAEDASDLWGTWHVTGSGATTWHDFAAVIFAEAARAGMRTPRLVAIGTADYPTPARRPAYSVLDTTRAKATLGIVMPAWQDGVRRTLAEIARQRSRTAQHEGADA